jgi:hypothetical protein
VKLKIPRKPEINTSVTALPLQENKNVLNSKQKSLFKTPVRAHIPTGRQKPLSISNGDQKTGHSRSPSPSQKLSAVTLLFARLAKKYASYF